MSMNDLDAPRQGGEGWTGNVFGATYADAYDLIYKDKDYGAECDLIQRLFQTYSDGPVSSVLDLGCGTGSHAIRLAQRGYEVVAVDHSESMLDHARRKAAALPRGVDITLLHGDLRSVEIERRFDAVLMMFAVLSYQLRNVDVLAGLGLAHKHLRSGGLLVFDVWFGPAVLHQRPSERVKLVPVPGGRLLRVASGELDILRHVCAVHYHLWRLEGERLVGQSEESHAMRYFFPLELDLFLESSGFAPLRLGAFPEFDRDPDETTWNALGVARAI